MAIEPHPDRPGFQEQDEGRIPRKLFWGPSFIWVVWFACGFTSLFWPMARDQGIYAYEAWRLLSGEQPFRDFWEIKGPGVQYVYALAQMAFGRNMWGIRIVDMLCQLFVAMLLRHTLSRRAGEVAAALAPVLFLLAYYSAHFWNTALCESFALPLMMLGVWWVNRGFSAPGLFSCFASGLCFGLMGWLKFHFVFLVAAPILQFLIWRLWRNVEAHQLIRSVGGLVVGTCAGIALLGFWALVVNVWPEMREVMFGFDLSAYRQASPMSWGARIDAIHHALLTAHPFLTILAAAGVILGLAGRRTECLEFVVLSLVGLVVVALGGKFHAYHWIVLFAPAAALAGYTSAQVVAAPKGAARTVGLVLVLAAFLGPGWGRVRELTQVVECLVGRNSWDGYYRRFVTENFSFPAVLDAAEYIRHATNQDDFVLVWAFDPLVNYLAKRPSPTRFAYPKPLMLISGNVCLKAWRAEFLEGVRRRQPEMIVIGRRDWTPIVGRSSRRGLDEFPEFKTFLLAEYKLERSSDWYEFWRRRR